MITLYQLERCPWCAAARQGLRNVGVEEYTIINVPYDRDDRDVVERVSGQRLVPVLVDGDTVVKDSRQVVKYLYETYGGPERERSIRELAADIAAGGSRA